MPSDSSATSSDQGSGSTQSDDSTGGHRLAVEFRVEVAATITPIRWPKRSLWQKPWAVLPAIKSLPKWSVLLLLGLPIKFKGDPKAVATLSHAIEHCVAGVWGSMPMPPQRVTPAEAKELASWVLAQKPVAPPKSA